MKDEETARKERWNAAYAALWRIFESGEKATLDKGFTNESQVEIVWQTPQRLYTRVKDETGEEWQVMTYRLSKI